MSDNSTGSNKSAPKNIAIKCIKQQLTEEKDRQIHNHIWRIQYNTIPTCHGVTKPVCHNYWAHTLEPASLSYWSPCTWSPRSATREAAAVRSLRTAGKSRPGSPKPEKAVLSNEDPAQPTNKYILKKEKHNIMNNFMPPNMNI